MSRYEGLNLPELMELMHDIVMPEPVSWLPTTPGWWVLLCWLLASTLLIVWYTASRHRQNRYRREALAELKTIERNTALTPAESALQISALLKRTALAAYPRADVAPLYGSDWANFLLKSAGNDPEIASAAAVFAAGAYRSDADGQIMSKPARRWIRRHRA